MELITKPQMEQLKKNGRKPNEDYPPVVKIFTPDAGATWLLQSVDPQDQDLAFGLCDLGIGFPEMGYVRISEIREVRGALNLPPERDLYTILEKTLMQYWEESLTKGSVAV